MGTTYRKTSYQKTFNWDFCSLFLAWHSLLLRAAHTEDYCQECFHIWRERVSSCQMLWNLHREGHSQHRNLTLAPSISPEDIFAHWGDSIYTMGSHSAKSMLAVMVWFGNHLKCILPMLLFCSVPDSGYNYISQGNNKNHVPISYHSFLPITIFLSVTTSACLTFRNLWPWKDNIKINVYKCTWLHIYAWGDN